MDWTYDINTIIEVFEGLMKTYSGNGPRGEIQKDPKRYACLKSIYDNPEFREGWPLLYTYKLIAKDIHYEK